MNRQTGGKTFLVLGGMSVFLVIFDIFANFGDWTEFLWFCPVTASLLAYALLRRSALAMSVCLVLSVPAQSLWALDFVLQLLGRGMGRTAMLEPCGPLIYWGSAVIHTFVIPVSFWGVTRLGFDRRSLLWSLLYGGGLLVLTFLMTPPFKNVNCVFFPCDADDPGSGYLAYFLSRSVLLWALIVPFSYAVFRYLLRNHLYGSGSAGRPGA